MVATDPHPGRPAGDIPGGLHFTHWLAHAPFRHAGPHHPPVDERRAAMGRRPVDVINGIDGSLYLSDDAGGKIYRFFYVGS
jgi:glucose/arabinose dehydrogenase